MDRRVDRILFEWRRLERELTANIDDDTREDLEARISTLREEHRRAVSGVVAHQQTDGRTDRPERGTEVATEGA